MPVPLKQAVATAMSTFSEVYPDSDDMRLEEFAIRDDGTTEVTISGLVPAPKNPNSLFPLADIMKVAERIYRGFRVDESGTVKEMKMRSVNG